MSPNPTVERGIVVAPLSNRGHWTSAMLERKSRSKRNSTGFRRGLFQSFGCIINY